MKPTIYHLFRILSLAALIALNYGCNNTNQSPQKEKHEKRALHITVSKDSEGKFKQWLKSCEQDEDSLIFAGMYHFHNKDSFDIYLSKADGIIISGGEDVNPALYGKPEAIERCGTIDNRRDSLELLMIRYAYENKIPLLAVCRGHQLLNVAFGGSLIPDIPEDYGSPTMHRNNGSTEHIVKLRAGSRLYEYTQTDSAQVYSNHHQAVNRLAEGFTATSYAPDGITESIENSDTTNHPFILGVQWHPEAMDFSHPLSAKIGKKFLSEVKKQANNN